MDMFFDVGYLFWNYTETTEHLVMLDCLLGWKWRLSEENERPLEGSEPWRPPLYLQVGSGYLTGELSQAAGPCLHSLCAGVACGSSTLEQMPFRLCSPNLWEMSVPSVCQPALLLSMDLSVTLTEGLVSVFPNAPILVAQEHFMMSLDWSGCLPRKPCWVALTYMTLRQFAWNTEPTPAKEQTVEETSHKWETGLSEDTILT